MSYSYTPTEINPKTPYSSHECTTYVALGDGQAVKVTTSGHGVHAYMVTRKVENGFSSESTLLFGNGQTRLGAPIAAPVTAKKVQALHAATLAAWEPAQVVAAVLEKLKKGE